MRFDWYSATIEAPATEVIDGLSAALGATEREGKPFNGYEHGVDLDLGGSTVAKVWYGGNGGHPFAFASSDSTDAFVEAVRRLWPAHRVTRVDAAEDFDGAGSWDRLYGLAEAFALERGLAVDQAGDWLRLEAGRTFYVGGRKSAVRLRVYEKGKQLLGEAALAGVHELPGISPDLVRVELQVRPDKEARWTAAALRPEDFYGFSVWSRDFLGALTGEDVERVTIREARATDVERSVGWMTRQYADTFDRLVEWLGSERKALEYIRVGFTHERRRRAAA